MRDWPPTREGGGAAGLPCLMPSRCSIGTSSLLDDSLASCAASSGFAVNGGSGGGGDVGDDDDERVVALLPSWRSAEAAISGMNWRT